MGGYDEWLRLLDAAADQTASKAAAAKPAKAAARRKPPDAPRRLTYKEKLELASLPGVIERLEADIQRQHEAMADPEFYKLPGDEIARQTAALRQLDERLAEVFQRWEELEALAD